MSFQVTLQPSGHSFEVAENELVLDAAMRHAIDLPYGCRNGVCASCAATLLSGEVSYLRKPDALSASMQHNNQALLCMAIPISDLVIQTDEFDEMTLPVKKLRCRLEQKQKLSHDVMLIKIKIAAH